MRSLIKVFQVNRGAFQLNARQNMLNRYILLSIRWIQINITQQSFEWILNSDIEHVEVIVKRHIYATSMKHHLEVFGGDLLNKIDIKITKSLTETIYILY